MNILPRTKGLLGLEVENFDMFSVQAGAFSKLLDKFTKSFCTKPKRLRSHVDIS